MPPHATLGPFLVTRISLPDRDNRRLDKANPRAQLKEGEANLEEPYSTSGRSIHSHGEFQYEGISKVSDEVSKPCAPLGR